MLWRKSQSYVFWSEIRTLAEAVTAALSNHFPSWLLLAWTEEVFGHCRIGAHGMNALLCE